MYSVSGIVEINYRGSARHKQIGVIQAKVYDPYIKDYLYTIRYENGGTGMYTERELKVLA